MSDIKFDAKKVRGLFVVSGCVAAVGLMSLSLNNFAPALYASDNGVSVAFQGQVQGISQLIQQGKLDQAQIAVDEFWTRHKSEAGFSDALDLIKEAYWQNNQHAAFYALCQRITDEFPGQSMAVAASADMARGYIFDKDLKKAAESLKQFRAIGSADKNYEQYSRKIEVAANADVVRESITKGDFTQAAEKLQLFWQNDRNDEHFLEYIRQAKDLLWEKKQYQMHYALCDQIIAEFPGDTLAVATSADVVRGYIYNGDNAKAAEKLADFWKSGRSDANFLKYARQIKDLLWEKKQYDEHYALCDRIINEFPNDTLAVATFADVVRGYIYNGDYAKAADKLNDFWNYGYADANFLENARQIKDLLWEKKQYDEHFSLCEQIIAAFPDDKLTAETRSDLVTGYIFQKDLAKAAEKLEDFWNNSQADENFLSLARTIKDIYWQEGYHTEHFALCDRIIKAYPTDPLAVATRSDVVWAYIADKDYDKAKQKLEEYWKQDSNSEKFVEFTSHIAGKYWDMGEFDSCFALTDRLVKEFPAHLLTMEIRAQQIGRYVKRGMNSRADEKITAFLKDYREDSRLPEQLKTVKTALNEAKRFDKTVELDKWYLARHGEKDTALAARDSAIRAYLTGGNTQSARGELAEFKKLSNMPGFVGLLHDLGGEFTKSGDYTTALQIFTDLKKQYPTHERAAGFQRSIIETSFAMGDQSSVDRELGIMLNDYTSHPAFVEQTRNLADFFDKAKDYDRYIAIYDSLVKTLPGHEDAIKFNAEIIKANIKKGAMEQADTLFETLTSKYGQDSNYAKVVNDVGDTCRKAKKYVKAVGLYRKTLATKCSQEDSIAAYAGIAKAAVRLDNYIIDPSTYEVRESKQDVAVVMEEELDSLDIVPGKTVSANSAVRAKNDLVIDSIIKKLMDSYIANQKHDYLVIEIGEEYFFRGQESVMMGEEQICADMQRSIDVFENSLTPYADSGYQCIRLFSMAMAYQRMGSRETAIELFQQVLKQWPDFEKNWFAQVMIVECYDRMYLRGNMTNDEIKAKVIEACHDLLEKYPNCKVVDFVQKKLNIYNAM